VSDFFVSYALHRYFYRTSEQQYAIVIIAILRALASPFCRAAILDSVEAAQMLLLRWTTAVHCAVHPWLWFFVCMISLTFSENLLTIIARLFNVTYTAILRAFQLPTVLVCFNWRLIPLWDYVQEIVRLNLCYWLCLRYYALLSWSSADSYNVS